MSRYPPSDYRGPRDRSRSPPRFPDRRASAASIFDNRPPGPPRTASDAPRGPRTQFDGLRPPLNAGPGSTGNARPGYASLRDAPPLGSGDRARTYREREYDRRDRQPSPRDRSPARNFKDSREFSPRELDVNRVRRESRDGPLPAGINYSDSQPPVPGSSSARGSIPRGRGRGDFSFRGGRGGRDERDGFRRERSPPPRWPSDLSRDTREVERRDDRRFERREDERRPSEWSERDRERDVRRDQPPPRLESRTPSESISAVNTSNQAPQPPHVNPERLAMIERASADGAARRPSMQQEPYLNGRAETTANRYGSRGSSPPTQAPPVPAFTLSFAPPAAAPAPPSQPSTNAQAPRSPQETRNVVPATDEASSQQTKVPEEPRPEPPSDAPIAPRMPPAAPKAQLVSPPPAAPRGPRAHDAEDATGAINRLQPSRSLENFPGSGVAPARPALAQTDPNSSQWHPATSTSPAPAVPLLVQPVSPNTSQSARLADLNPPTGPRASRMSPGQTSVSPRPPFASPRSDIARPAGIPRMQTPPPSAPSGPRNRSYSISPKVANSSVPTEPKANRGPPMVPRGPERAPVAAARAPDRLVAPPWAPPSAPRGAAVWNQWKRPGAPAYGDKTIPAKRDMYGEEKSRTDDQISTPASTDHHAIGGFRSEPQIARSSETVHREDQRRTSDMELDKQPPRRQSSMMNSHSAARSFFGKPTEGEDEDSAISDTAQELPSTSSDDESDIENDLALFQAKFERQKRQLEAKLVDLSTRHYRATTPLENVARLARISARDLERFNEQREHDMDVDRSPVARRNRTFSATRHSSDSGEALDVVTPKDDEDRRVAIRSSDGSSDGARRVRRPTPEPVNLPYLLKDTHMPFNDSDLFRESLQRHEESKADLVEAMKDEVQMQDDVEANIEAAFVDEFTKWREEYEQLDKIKEDQDKLERQQSHEPKPEIDAPSVAQVNPVYEGRRLHKFSSEYEIEQVLKQSEETARIEQERQERELRKSAADMEKEAKIPDLLDEDEKSRSRFVDTNRYREAELLTDEFSYIPPVDDFTENEQHIFIAAFKETPKKWGEIASLLPGRDYRDCIRHYYANKWDGRFRDHRTKKLKMGGRRGRGGAKGPRGRIGGLMADLARAEDFLSPDAMNEKGRPKRAAAPTTFAEKEAEAKANLLGPSPAKKPGLGMKSDTNGEAGPEKPGKRQKRVGDKPGRKGNKSTAPLAALAAAPQGSPRSQLAHEMHSREDLANANLLASFHNGSHGVPHSDTHMIYRQEGYMQPVPPLPEESERPKGAAQVATGKQGASSYWSVPEQNDFVKYIGHFGRDFGAIAAHMGTKTQTMIKNHYQRQVDGGNRPELEKAAIDADERRARGEDVGPPPTPTPITKRKYENPPAPAQRPLAPHGESNDVEETAPPQRAQPPSQRSPPQYQPASRFSSSIQSTSIAAPRVGPSPLGTTAATANPMSATSHSRPMQQAYGSRITFLPDTRSDVRPSAQGVPGYRASQESPKHSQPPAQTNRPIPDAKDPNFLRNLVEQQQQAQRVEQRGQERAEVFSAQRQPTMQRNPSQGSPVNPPQHSFTDRKPILEDRALSPTRSTFASPAFPRSLFGMGNFPPISGTSMSPISRRPAFDISPPKREDSRGSAFSPTASAPPPAAAVPPPEPKRSNVLSLLNSEPDEPRPPKRDSLPPGPLRTASPISQGFGTTSSATPLSGVPAPKREPSFGQTSSLQSQFHRGSFGQLSSISTPASHGHKHEPSPGSGSSSQPVKHDWAARVLGQTSQASPPTPTLDRDTRAYQPHRSILGSLGSTRINPSPPPLSTNPHSRTPSLTGASSQQVREPLREQPRPSLSGPQPVQPLQPNPYGNAPQQLFSNPHAAQAQNQSHHAHNSSHGGPFPAFHSRNVSRDDYTRPEQARLEHVGTAQRESEEQELRLRQQREALEAERRREDPYLLQRRQESDRERQHAHSRGPPPPIQPPTFSSSAFGQNRSLDLRSQSRLESEMVMLREEQERQRQQMETERRRQEELTRPRQDEIARQREADERRRQEDERRRREDGMMFRRADAFGALPPGSGRR